MNTNVVNLELVLPLVVVIVSCLLMPIRTQRHFDHHVALFFFGDSYFDVGNNNYINTTTMYQANFWPYGESYFNPPTGRNSNGRVIPDFIAEYAKLPLIPAYLDPSLRDYDFVYGANFASTGSGALVETNAGFVIDLKTQLRYFEDLAKRFRQNLGDEKAEQLLSNAIYLFSCVGNDYVSSGNLRDSYPREKFVEMVIGNLTDVFKEIYEKGGRKFAMLGLPPLACMPGNRAGIMCNEELGVISILHNHKLYDKLKEIDTQLEGFMYAIFDLYNSIGDRMTSPSKYGLKVGDTACCGRGLFREINACGGKRYGPEFELCDDVDDYLFFDAYHLTEVACRQLSELFWNGDSNVTMLYNLNTLVQGRNPGLLSSG